MDLQSKNLKAYKNIDKSDWQQRKVDSQKGMRTFKTWC